MNRPRQRAETQVEEIPDLPLHLKYRPTTFDDVIGQDHAVKSLRDVLKKPTRPHAYIFTGPAGTGKTTLARILMKQLGCQPANIIEADAATNNGIDAMRALTDGLRYQGFGASPNKGIIIDEAHAISKQAWQSLLKSVEEPPAHVYWVFCTTEAGKIPEAIVTRCHNYTLKEVRRDDVYDLVAFVAGQEKLKTPDNILDVVVGAAGGSPRKALVMLSMVGDVTDPKEAAQILATPLDNKDIIDLCRLLLDRKLTWVKLTSTLRAIEGLSAEGARIVIANYLAGCLMNAKNDGAARDILDTLYPFRQPFVSTDKLAPLLLAFGEVMFA